MGLSHPSSGSNILVEGRRGAVTVCEEVLRIPKPLLLVCLLGLH